ncbi:MAG: hypothetical protein HFG65_13725 [Hungatella sp.]|nr:hypothetical protein [Hungatella sp.]
MKNTLWNRLPKMGKGADVCSYAWLIQEPFPLTGRTALTNQAVPMGQKMSFTQTSHIKNGIR